MKVRPTKRLYRYTAVPILFHVALVAAPTRYFRMPASVDSTIESVKDAYPHSSVSDTWIEVADADSHDFIRSISISSELVALGFVHRGALGRDEMPLCLKVFDRIYAVHGGPDIVQKHSVEAVKVHRRVWKRGNEYLGLRCYERDGERYAERVELYRFGDGAT